VSPNNSKKSESRGLVRLFLDYYSDYHVFWHYESEGGRRRVFQRDLSYGVQGDLSGLIEQVRAGGVSVIITKKGKPAALLTSLPNKKVDRVQAGAMKGESELLGDIISPASEDDWEVCGVILLDTHIWYRFLEDREELRVELKERIESSPEEILLSPISVWELMVLDRKKRVRLFPDAQRYVRKALELYPFKKAPLSEEVVIRSETKEFHHKDPADRFLAATALVYGAELATDDIALRELSWLRCC
jgi:prevent-host-death family protein